MLLSNNHIEANDTVFTKRLHPRHLRCTDGRQSNANIVLLLLLPQTLNAKEMIEEAAGGGQHH